MAIESIPLRRSEQNYLNKLTESVVGPPIHEGEQGCVVIPVHCNEEGTLWHTLEVYDGFEELHSGKFAVFTFINDRSYKNLLSSPAYRVAEQFRYEHPDFPLITAHASYQHPKIGTLRRDASLLSLERAEKGGASLDNYFLIHHDADLVDLSPGYFSEGLRHFEADEQLALLTALPYYDAQDYGSMQTLLWSQRFVDVLSIYHRYSSGYIRGEENNMWVRGSAYLASGGHNRARVSEASLMVKNLQQKDEAAVKASTQKPMRARYSPRRHISVVRSGTLFADRYEHFGRETDHVHGDLTFQKKEELSYEGLNPETLTIELNEMFFHYVLNILFRGLPNITEATDLTGDNAYLLCQQNFPDQLASIEKKFKKCAGLLGVTIAFDENKIVVV